MKKILVATLLTTWVLTPSAWAQVPDFTPQTPLIGALLHNEMPEAMRLVMDGADPNEGRFFGMPPLMLAVQRQHIDLVRMLVAKGADLTARDSSGSTVGRRERGGRGRHDRGVASHGG